MTMNKEKHIKKILDASRKYNIGHIPSALSLAKITRMLWTYQNIEDFPIIIGKSFGVQAWFIDDSVQESFIHDFVSYGRKIIIPKDFSRSKFNVVYSQSQLGLTSGFSAGYAIGNPDLKKAICILSDADCFLESTLHGIEFSFQNSLPISFIVDANNIQLFGSKNCRMLFDNFGYSEQNDILRLTSDIPEVIIVSTIKGDGCPLFEKNPKDWHYRIPDKDEWDMIYEEIS